MRFRHFILLIFSLLVLSAGLILFINPWSTTSDAFNDLLPGKVSAIDKLLIVSEMDSLIFQLKKENWMLGTEELNNQAVQNLILAAGNLHMNSIIQKEDLPELRSVLKLKFFKGNKQLTSFYFAQSEKKYFIFQKNSNMVYGTELAGYEGMHLEKYFSGNPDHYRKHLLVNLLPSEIKRIQIIPIKGKPFIAFQDTSYTISVSNLSQTESYTGRVNEEKIHMLFSYFTAIRYEREISNEELADDNLPNNLSASVSLTDFSDNTSKIDIYKYFKKPGNQEDIFKAVVVFNDGPRLLLVDYYYLDLLIRGLEKYMID